MPSFFWVVVHAAAVVVGDRLLIYSCRLFELKIVSVLTSVCKYINTWKKKKAVCVVVEKELEPIVK
jgi:hypothetical protein